MYSSHAPTKLNVDSRLKYVFIMDESHASLGGIDNITDPTWKPPQTYVILDLELECVWDTHKPMFVNDLIKSHSDRIKERPLLTLNGAFSILANNFETNQFLYAEELRNFLLSSPGIHSQMAVVFTWCWPSTGLTSWTLKHLLEIITSIPLSVLIVP